MINLKLVKIVKKYKWVILLLVFLPTITALFVPGYFGASDELHIAWLMEMDKVLRLGQYPPRFVPTLSYGFGYPLFNFVFPLPFYIGEIFHFIGFNFVDSVKMLLGLTLISSGFAMYAFLKQFKSDLLSFAGAILYVYTPYRATEIYVRGAVGEALSFVFFPLILLGAKKILDNKKLNWNNVGIFSLSFGLLILSHNIAALTFTAFLILLILIIVVFQKSNRISFVKNISIAIVIGFLMSAYFWVPAIYESKYFKPDTVFDVRDHFPTIKQLVIPYFGYGASVPGPYDGISFYIGLANLILFVLSILYLAARRIKQEATRAFFLWGILIFLFSIFMMNYRSTFIWMNVPYLDYFQFPWRFLTITTLASPLFLIPFTDSSKILKVIISGVALSSIFIFPWFRPQDFLGRTDEHFVRTYLPSDPISTEYRNNTEEYLRMPKDQTERPKNLYNFIYSNGISKITVQNMTPLSFKGRVTMNSDAVVNVSKYYLPGWYALIDGKRASLSPGKPFGQIVFEIKKGEHSIDVGFGETSQRMFLDLLSFASFVFVLSKLIPIHFKQKRLTGKM